VKFLSRIWGLEELIAEGKITKEQADQVMEDFIHKQLK
jgi:polyhydroxyalkanoate synthesis regulator phasin